MKGIIKNVMDGKNFGFIRGTNGGEYFFHRDEFHGYWNDLVADIKTDKNIQVQFEPVESPKGARASDVYRTEHPNAGR